MTFKRPSLLIFALCAALCGCNKIPTEVNPNKAEDLTSENTTTPPKEQSKEDRVPVYPMVDESLELKGAPSERLLELLLRKDPKIPHSLSPSEIQPHQIREIKILTDSLLAKADAKDQKDKHNVIFRWIRQNVKYGHTQDPSIPAYNSAYSTFKYRNAICQGYASLLKVMCQINGISAPMVNGLARFNTLGDPGGHAWNYVLLDGTWYVSDATNGIFYRADDIKRKDFLLPEQIDFPIYEDQNIVCCYQNREMTLTEVSDSAVKEDYFTVPYSTDGVRITNLNPHILPKHLRVLYIGSNIKMLGTPDNRKLKESGDQLQSIYIDPQNPFLESYKGVIYDKINNPNLPLLIPAQQIRVELKPIKHVEKNTIYGHTGVKELHFAEGTETIDAYAVEDCPNLQTIYLPKSISKVDPKAFDKCHPSLSIIRKQ